MALYEATISSPMSAEEAFDYVADLRNLETWDPGVSVAKLVSDEPIELGTEFFVSANGANIDYKMEEFERPSRFKFAGKTRFFTSVDIITFAPTDSGCEVTYLARLDLNGPLRIADKLLARKFLKICDPAGQGLADALDGEVLQGSLV